MRRDKAGRGEAAQALRGLGGRDSRAAGGFVCGAAQGAVPLRLATAGSPPAHQSPGWLAWPARVRQVDGIGNLLELNGRFAAELDAPVLMVRRAVLRAALRCAAPATPLPCPLFGAAQALQLQRSAMAGPSP